MQTRSREEVWLISTGQFRQVPRSALSVRWVKRTNSRIMGGANLSCRLSALESVSLIARVTSNCSMVRSQSRAFTIKRFCLALQSYERAPSSCFLHPFWLHHYRKLDTLCILHRSFVYNTLYFGAAVEGYCTLSLITHEAFDNGIIGVQQTLTTRKICPVTRDTA